MGSGETYCELVDNTLCRTCPLRSLVEADWRDISEPGVTPFQTADVLSSVLAGAAETQNRIASQIASLLEDVSQSEARISFNEMIEWDKRVAGAATAERFKGTLALDEAPAYVRRSFTDCIERNSYQGCSPDPSEETPASGLEGLISRELGARMLEALARKGRLPDVLSIIDTIQQFIDESSLPPIGRSELASRAFLLRFANLLANGDLA